MKIWGQTYSSFLHVPETLEQVSQLAVQENVLQPEASEGLEKLLSLTRCDQDNVLLNDSENTYLDVIPDQVFLVFQTIDSNDHGAPHLTCRKLKYHLFRQCRCDSNLTIFAGSVFEMLLEHYIARKA